MYIEKYMLKKSDLITLNPEETVSEALEKIEKGNFLSLPVVDGDIFKGYLMKETIYRKFFEYEGNDKDQYLNNVKVKEIYTNEYESIKKDELVEEASYLLKELNIPFLPVFNDYDEFIGILTHKAIFSVLSKILGLGRGSRLVINYFDMPGQLAKLTDIIRKENINIVNLTVIDTDLKNIYKAIIRVEVNREKDLDDLLKLIEDAGYRIENVRR